MNYLFTAIIFNVLLLSSCMSDAKNAVAVAKQKAMLNDSLAFYMNSGMADGNKVNVIRSIGIIDSLLKIDTVAANRYKYYMNRGILYAILGDSAQADKSKEKAVELLPAYHVDRLMFFGEKNLRNGNKDSSLVYLNKALKQCDDRLNKEMDYNMLAKKIQILILLNKKSEANDYLEDIMKEYSHNEFIEGLKDEVNELRQ